MNNYLKYLESGGFVKTIPLKHDIFHSGSVLQTDDLKGFYEYVKQRINNFKKDVFVPTKTNSSNNTNNKNTTTSSDISISSNPDNNYIRYISKSSDGPITYWF